MDEYLISRQNEILWKLLADPADNGQLYLYNLQRLVKDFPQSGLLHALFMRASGEQRVNNAAAYFDPHTLYALVNASESLAIVGDTQIVQETNATDVYAPSNENDLLKAAEDSGLNVFSDADMETHSDYVAETDEPHNLATGESEPLGEEDILVEPVTDTMQQEVPGLVREEEISDEHDIVPDEHEAEPIIITPENEHFYEDELVTEAGAYEEEEPEEAIVLSSGEAESITEPLIGDEQPGEIEEPIIEIAGDESVDEPVFFTPEAHKGIDDDVYDEIVGIENISFARVTKSTDGEIEAETSGGGEELPDAVNEATETTGQKDRPLNLDDEAEKLIVGNIAATDYFVFDRAVSDRKQESTPEENSSLPLPETVDEHPGTDIATGSENQEVSKYHDEKMPYTFMWWLDKTRREHAGIYQPFKLDTSQAIRQNGADELQQQYYENIFHINSIEELDKSTPHQTIEFDMKRKEDIIIKRFITEEPHISPPSNDKLDNENKAKKSAEDHDELVTETLAKIYADQMLYHKAINTYKKLILKFPEKSRYFADQIEQLERKTN